MSDSSVSVMQTSTNDVILTIAAAGASATATQTSTGGANVVTSSISADQQGFGFKSTANHKPKDTLDDVDDLSRARSPVATTEKPPNEGPKRRTSLARSSFSKPKSRLVEPPYPTTTDHPAILGEDHTAEPTPWPVSSKNSPLRRVSPRAGVNTPKESPPITPKTPLMTVQGGDDEEEDDDDIYKETILQAGQKSGKKIKFWVLFEWLLFVILVGLLIASLTVHPLRSFTIWSLRLWKWDVLVMVIFSGRLVTEWLIGILVFLIERNFIFKKKVLYFVYGMKKSVQVLLWFSLILLAWGLLFNDHGSVRRSRKAKKVLTHITKALAGCLVGAAIWLVKTLLIKMLAVSFHVKRFFDRIQESLFNQYVLHTLSGPPLMELAEKIGHTNTTTRSGQLSFGHTTKGGKDQVKEEVIDIQKLHKMRQEKVSAWTMKGLIQVISRSGLSTISSVIDDDNDGADDEKNKEITSEWEAKVASYKIFKNVAKPWHKYIDEEDLLRFMKKEEADHVFPLFEGATESGKIRRSALTKWVVNAYLERKSLAHSLTDTKTAVDELNNIASGIVLIVNVVVWNLMMGFLTTKILVFISSQLLLVVFMFGNTAKTVFEAIIFVFVMHPYDVGDRCVIDGVQMIVEEMNILTTIFLKYDNEKITYPNSVLSTKPISNFYRSPEMSDSVEFTVDFSTPVETIAALKARIKTYIESKPQYWRSGHSVLVKDIENMDKLKMALYVCHTINFQNMGEKSSRRAELVMELKKIFEELKLTYHLLPQDVHVSYVGSPASTSGAP